MGGTNDGKPRTINGLRLVPRQAPARCGERYGWDFLLYACARELYHAALQGPPKPITKSRCPTNARDGVPLTRTGAAGPVHEQDWRRSSVCVPTISVPVQKMTTPQLELSKRNILLLVGLSLKPDTYWFNHRPTAAQQQNPAARR